MHLVKRYRVKREMPGMKVGQEFYDIEVSNNVMEYDLEGARIWSPFGMQMVASRNEHYRTVSRIQLLEDGWIEKIEDVCQCSRKREETTTDGEKHAESTAKKKKS